MLCDSLICRHASHAYNINTLNDFGGMSLYTCIESTDQSPRCFELYNFRKIFFVKRKLNRLGIGFRYNFILVK